MVRRKPSAKVASIGVTRTQLYVEEELGWIFREQPTEDYGIDAHVEVVDGEQVSGRLLALQIKSGESWFDKPTAGGWWYRPDEGHVAYWTSHSLPVVVVLYNPVTKRCHWQLVNNKTLERSKAGGWRLLVLETNVLDTSAAVEWRTAADGDPYELRLRELRLAKPWMDMLAQGTRVVVDFAEWINKSTGRGSISIGIDHEDGNDPEELVTWHLFIGPTNYAETVPKLFAWADADVHEQTYHDAEYDQYEAECSVWDEGDQFFTASFADWRRGLVARGIRPYNNVAGEVDHYRLELTLNELGAAFLVVDEFATYGASAVDGVSNASAGRVRAMSFEHAYIDDMMLTWEQHQAGEPCRGCGRPLIDEAWEGRGTPRQTRGRDLIVCKPYGLDVGAGPWRTLACMIDALHVAHLRGYWAVLKIADVTSSAARNSAITSIGTLDTTRVRIPVRLSPEDVCCSASRVRTCGGAGGALEDISVTWPSGSSQWRVHVPSGICVVTRTPAPMVAA